MPGTPPPEDGRRLPNEREPVPPVPRWLGLSLIVLAWNVVRFWSIPAAVANTNGSGDAESARAIADTVEFVVQVNGKVRTRMIMRRGISEDEAREAALADPNVQRFTDGKAPRKNIFVPDRLLNLVEGAEAVVYLDPDTALFAPLTPDAVLPSNRD